jgi:8-oxo-dGTP pyrophosphatase MutT (NUDIX family)
MADDAIPAATLITVRDRADGPAELLMVERAEGMAFAAGALVFPGGRIDEADEELAAELGLDGGALVAAVRETLEETAIPVALTPTPDGEIAFDLQQRLAGDASFGELLRASGLAIDAAALTPFARWVPKFHAVRRFDTLFYVARAPDGDWQPKVIEGECAGAYWLTAEEVLEREQRAEARLIFPTRRTLERLAQHRSFGEIRADALAHAIEPISPWVEERDGERFITIPTGLGYPVTEERLDGLWRG